MTEAATEDDRQFEAVLSRLDALMKRSHALESSGEPEASEGVGSIADVPILTEVYQGAGLVQVRASDEEVPPTLTDFVSMPPVEVAVSTDVPEKVTDAVPAMTQEQELNAAIDAVMPMLREMVENVVREELFYAQQNLTLRITHEAEHMLRQRVLAGVRPK